MTGFKSKRQMAQEKTSMTKEALKLALEAIERYQIKRQDFDTFADVIAAYREALAQPEERNFCQRCGKRTADLTAIHTCTPPMENT